MNFYDVHCNSTQVMGTTGGNTADIVDAHKGLGCPEAEEYLLTDFIKE